MMITYKVRYLLDKFVLFQMKFAIPWWSHFLKQNFEEHEQRQTIPIQYSQALCLDNSVFWTEAFSSAHLQFFLFI